MSRIEARCRNASAFRLRLSQSLASLRQRFSQASVRSTIQRLDKTTNPLTRSERLRTCQAGSAVQSASIPRPSHRSDSATCCGHSERDSCSSTSVSPRIKATALESQLIHLISRTLRTDTKRWCASCHLVSADQQRASADVPPFAVIAQPPNFNPDRLAHFLLDPHPKMPELPLSRTAADDIAAYIGSLKK